MKKKFKKVKPVVEKAQNKKEEDKELDKRLKDTFPASDSTAKYL